MDLTSIPKIKHLDSGNFFLIAGPCAIEGEEMAFEIAAKVKELEGVGATRQEAVAQIATEFGLRKRAIFDALVASKIGQ